MTRFQIDNRIKNLTVHDKEYLGSEVVTGTNISFEETEKQLVIEVL